MDALSVAAFNLVDAYPGGARRLGQDIEHPNLSAEISGTGTAKLGLKEAVKISKLTGDLRILNAFAGEMHCMVLPLPAALSASDNCTIQDLGAMAREFAQLVQEITAAVADGDITANEIARVRREWGELQSVGQKAVANLEAKHEAGKPEALRRVA